MYSYYLAQFVRSALRSENLTKRFLISSSSFQLFGHRRILVQKLRLSGDTSPRHGERTTFTVFRTFAHFLLK